MVALRVDLVFSYWIYIWYLLYEFKVTKYSPKFILILGLIDNIIMFILMLLYNTSKKTILYFVLINLLIKVIPLYYLRNKSIKISEIYITFGLFFIFIIWLYLNKQSLIGNIKLIYHSLLYSKHNTPFISLIYKIKNNFKKLEVL